MRRSATSKKPVPTPAVSSTHALARIGLALASGLAMGLAFPKFDLNVLAWVGLVPLLYAIEGLRLRGVFAYSLLQGLVLYVLTLYWAVIPLHTFADAPLWMAVGPMLLLAAVEALFVAGTMVGAIFIGRRLRIPILLTLPIVWAAVEW